MNPYAVPLDVVFADGPAPGFVDKLQLFGQFVGSWELEVVYHGPTGERTLTAEWHFAWALDGHAVQDVWIAPHRRDRERGEPPVDWGTTVRFYDPRIDAWRSTWIGPAKGLVLPFIARPVGDQIVLEGQLRGRQADPLGLLGHRAGVVPLAGGRVGGRRTELVAGPGDVRPPNRTRAGRRCPGGNDPVTEWGALLAADGPRFGWFSDRVLAVFRPRARAARSPLHGVD